MKLLIITGMSGAGKSYAVKFLEDMGYFCVDNMPPALLPKFTELFTKSNGTLMDKIAMVMDIRSGEMLEEIIPTLMSIEKAGASYEILFLDCSDGTLINRFKENRRLHPLSPEGNTPEGIKLEREKLKQIRNISTYVVDTTDLSPWDLKRELQELFLYERKSKGLKISVISFGFKYGIPASCDMVLDVRFIPNPYYIEALKLHTGIDNDVRDFVLKTKETKEFLKKLNDLLKFLLPNYEKEGKEILVIGIGCTGGRHRSVAIADSIAESLSLLGYSAYTEHRDIEK
ncbi:MAG: RNase adapter RapZ [Clostridiales bacterium]|jgi:UPF0042 nucleotide-binding protein|nr:RNase adapter RapZ [Clostridiales bacterium]